MFPAGRKTEAKKVKSLPNKKRTLQDRLLLAAALCALAATVLLLIRPICVFVTGRQHEAAIAEYTEAVARLSREELDELREQALSYNRDRAENRPTVWGVPTQEEAALYDSLLCVPGTEVIAWIEIPAIRVRLPIYRGATDENMRRGCGHMECSSLPIGGADGHAVLVSHRNLATAVTFEHLDLLTEGDLFSVTALGETVTFQIDEIREVDPARGEEYLDMRIEEGKETCTLVTCTPNGGTERRLFVRGERIRGE